MSVVIIDGKSLEFNPGETVIQVAQRNGIDIPHFCWHPKLSISGNCRVCLVEVEKMPKLVIACATLAADGMVVNTQSQKTLDARKAVMEFLLINHPLDCPICDEAGECKLQDYTYDHSIGESRFKETKQHKQKRVPLGPYVMFDGERCISCSRCIRFCEEVPKTSELTFVERGDRVTIVTYPGKQLDNNYSLNVTDICPVGALTNRDFRFKARVWEMSSTKSICTGCARGCNTEVWVRNNLILRLTPRLNEDVNSYWMCDYGRINSFPHVNAEDRIVDAHVKTDDGFFISDWDEAYKLAAHKLSGFKGDQIAFIGSPFTSCEDNFMLNKLAKQFHAKSVEFRRVEDPTFGDELLRRNDITPNTKGAEAVGLGKDPNGLSAVLKNLNDGKVKCAVIMEDDLAAFPEWKKALEKLECLIVLGTNWNETAKMATMVFASSTFAEKNGVYVNFQGRAQRVRPSVATEDADRSFDGYTLSRLDKFGTEFDKWAKKNKKDAYPSWKILAAISEHAGAKNKFQMAEDVFDEITRTIPDFAGLDYELIGDLGALLGSASKKELKGVNI